MNQPSIHTALVASSLLQLDQVGGKEWTIEYDGPSLEAVLNSLRYGPDGAQQQVQFPVRPDCKSATAFMLVCTVSTFTWQSPQHQLCHLVANVDLGKNGKVVNCLVKIDYCFKTRAGSIQFAYGGLLVQQPEAVDA